MAAESVPVATSPTPNRRLVSSVLSPALVQRLTSVVVTGSNPATVPVQAPFTGEQIAELPQSTPGDVQFAYDRARDAQREWVKQPVRERAAAFLRYHDLILARQSEALDLIQIESGKTRAHAFEEVADVALTARYYSRTAQGYLRSRRRRGVLPVLTRAYELRHPRGVVGIISPWNYPLTLAASDAIPAFLAGNGVVLKPDNQTALTALWARELAVEAGLPAALWQVVLADGPVIGPAMVDHADFISFTGSTRAGRQVGQQAAYSLIGCSLELGGKNSMIVLDDAPVDRAAACALRASFASAGQLCISMERILVHDKIYDAFIDRFLTQVRAMRLGPDLEFGPDMGSLVSRRQLDTVVDHVEDARAKGAKVLTGGRPRPEFGPLFYEPTVLGEVTPEMTVYAEETFGPVVSVYRFASDEEAIRRASDTPYGLNAAVWTRNARRGRQVASQLRVGVVNVNEGYAAGWASVDTPMGGMGDSGVSRRHSAEGILKYTEPQAVVVQRLIQATAPPYGLSERLWSKVIVLWLRLAKFLRLK